VNEHPIVDGPIEYAVGYLEHHDSPNLHHWVDKQNRYSTSEALNFFCNEKLSAEPLLWGNRFQRRMWFKKHYVRIPFRYFLNLLINLIHARVWRSGRAGFTWARLRVWVRRMKEDKIREMESSGKLFNLPQAPTGKPHPDVEQFD
jgi:hypothetical protein